MRCDKPVICDVAPRDGFQSIAASLPTEEKIAIIRDLAAAGCPRIEIALCDTTGRASPFEVSRRFRTMMALPDALGVDWAFHGHDTYGRAVANALAAWNAGMRVFDTAAAGLGGCPLAPGATGNTATEDLVFAFNAGGLDTGIDMARFLSVADRIAALPVGVTGSHLRHMPRDRAA